MQNCVLTLALLNLVILGGCNTGPEIMSSPTFTAQAASTPKLDSTPEPRMPILKEIVKRQHSGQSKTSEELADYANSLLPRYGFEYDLDLERIITRKTKQRQTKPVKVEDDGMPYVKFELDVTSTKGAKKKLAVVAPAESSCCCGYYYTPIPVTKITSKEITLVLDSQELIVNRPKDFPIVQEYILSEVKKKLTRLRSWEVPYETYPYGVSTDGKKLYVKIDIEELLLEVSDVGTLRFVPKDAKDIVTKGEDLNKLPPPKVGDVLIKSGELGLMRYVLNGKPYVLEFPYPCT